MKTPERTTLSPLAKSKAAPPSAGTPVGVLEIPVRVQGSHRVAAVPGQPQHLEPFSEETSTVIIFENGGVIRLSASTAPGDIVLVTNSRSRQEELCRVVSVKKHPNVKGYAEIEFRRPTTGFWGEYAPHGSLKRRAAAGIPMAIPEKPAHSQAAPETVSDSVFASAAAPVTSETRFAAQYASPLLLVEGPRSLNKRVLITAVIVLLAAGASGTLLMRRGAARPSMIAENALSPAASTDSTSQNTATGAPFPNETYPATSPIGVETKGLLSLQSQNLADNIDALQPASAALEKRPAWTEKNPLLGAHVAERRSPDKISPPELTGVDPNSGADAIRRVIASSANSSAGGLFAEPRLVYKVVPTFPPAAENIGLEGEVVIDAIIDSTGKPTELRAVSGPALLQQTALDAVRKWKYEPSYLGGKPVPVETSITIDFHRQ